MDTFSQFEPPKKPIRPPAERVNVSPQPAPPQQPPNPPRKPTKPPSMWESFWAGFNDKSKYKTEDAHRVWLDLRITPQEWLAKYPGTTMKNYRAWRKQVAPVRPNWLQKTLIPKEIRRRWNF